MAILVGGVPLLAAALLRAGRTSGIVATALAGLILLGFEVVEVAAIDRNTGDLFPLVVLLQSTYTLLGLGMLAGAVLLRMGNERARGDKEGPDERR